MTEPFRLVSKNGRCEFTLHNTGRVSISHDGEMVATGLLIWDQEKRQYVLMPRIGPKPEPGPGNLPRLIANTDRFLLNDRNKLILPLQRRMDIREASMFSAYRLWLDDKGDELNKTLDTLRREGDINSVRVMLNLGDGVFWKGFGTSYKDPRFYKELPSFIQFLDANQFYCHLTIIGGTDVFGVSLGGPVSAQSELDMHNCIQNVANVLSGEDNWFPQISNEPSHLIHGFGTNSPVVVRLTRALRVQLNSLSWPNAPIDMGAQGEDEWAYASPPASAFAYHLKRDGRWDHFGDLKRMIHGDPDAWNRPVYDDEAANQGDLIKPNGGTADGTSSTAFSFALAVSCRLKHCAIQCFHFNEGLWSRCEKTKTIQSLRAWRNGLDLVPLRPMGAEWNGGHVDSMLPDDSQLPPTEASEDNWDGPVRVWGRRNWAISLREPKGFNLKVNSGVETLHIEQWGQWQSRLLFRR